MERSKAINNRENLVEQDQSDFGAIPTMQKDFRQYYDLWTVVDMWKKNHHSW
jgi:hypothetical protein